MTNFENEDNRGQEATFSHAEALKRRLSELDAQKSAWVKEDSSIEAMVKKPEEISPLSTIKGIDSISEGTDGVKASVEGNYDTVFGRDSAIIGLSLVDKQPELAKNIIFSLASRQGTAENSKSEESPGKIHHEERKIDPEKSAHGIRGVIGKIAETVWTKEDENSTEKRRISYVSADSTPLFIKLVSEYCSSNGTEILDKPVTLKNGKTITIRQCVEDATSWVESNINPNGLFEVKRRNKLQNPFGQTWKDSLTGMIRPDGSLATINGRIIYPELQTLAIDALESSARMMEPTNPELTKKRQAEAAKLKEETIKALWSEEDGFFVSGLEELSNGNMAQIRTLESSAGRMLNSELFDDLNEEEKQKYITAVIEKLFSEEFLTDAGIRSRSLRHADKMDNADYHGSYVSWPTDTFQIAEGLRKQGFPALAEQLENRILNTINMAGSAYEFFFVDENGKPILNYKDKKGGASGTLAVTLVPEHNQGWTFSAAIDIKRGRGAKKGAAEHATAESWQADLEQKILSDIKIVEPHKTREEMANNYPAEISDTKLDRLSGFARTGKYFAHEVAKQVADAQKIKRQK